MKYKIWDLFIDILFKLFVGKEDLSGQDEEKDYYSNRYNN